MAKYTDNICGYLDILDDEFAFNIVDQQVTLLPAEKDHIQKNDAVNRIRNNYHELPDYFIGTDDHYYKIAIFKNQNKTISPILLSYPSFHFATPLIIKAAGNAQGLYDKMTEPWHKFHVINFYGGNINSIYDPAVSIIQPTWEEVSSPSGIRDIKFRAYEDFTKSINCEIDGEKFDFFITVTQKGDGNDSEKMGSYNLGERNACIRLVFEKPQDFDTFPKYFNIIQKLVAILTKQNNVTFRAYLCQKRPNEKLLYPTAVCYTFERYEDFSKRGPDKVVPIETILTYIPELINRISSDFYAPLLALLPDSNKEAKRISITNVQDLCTALEVVYGWNHENRKKDQLIEELKSDIKKTIREFTKRHHDEINISLQTNISSSFEYLNYTLRGKIHTLYMENKEIIDEITHKWGLPDLSFDEISKFVKLRNNKTHSGIIDWGNAAQVYEPLFGLTYTCFYRETGIPDDSINIMIHNFF